MSGRNNDDNNNTNHGSKGKEAARGPALTCGRLPSSAARRRRTRGARGARGRAPAGSTPAPAAAARARTARTAAGPPAPPAPSPATPTPPLSPAGVRPAPRTPRPGPALPRCRPTCWWPMRGAARPGPAPPWRRRAAPAARAARPPWPRRRARVRLTRRARARGPDAALTGEAPSLGGDAGLARHGPVPEAAPTSTYRHSCAETALGVQIHQASSTTGETFRRLHLLANKGMDVYWLQVTQFSY